MSLTQRRSKVRIERPVLTLFEGRQAGIKAAMNKFVRSAFRLQDLLAGQMRLTAEGGKNAMFVLDLCPNLTVSRWFKVIDEAEIQAMNEHVLSTHREEILRDSPSD